MKHKNEVLEYLMKPISNIQVDIWLKANNIIHEKSELFHDFLFSLLKLIENTYMGDDVTGLDEDKQKHFDWCWNKIIGDFEKEKIVFEKSGHHYDMLWSLFQDSFYSEDDKENTMRVQEFLNRLFNLTAKKTKSELDMLGDLYKILEKSLKPAF